MKKLIIFLIPLIVSIPAFAKEKSSFTENFSLVKYSGDNIRKVFEIDIFSERTPLSIIDTVENINQRWGNRYSLIYGHQEDINSEKKSEPLAEGYLRRLAERSKKSRKKGGSLGLVFGVAALAGGVALMSSEESGSGLEDDIGAILMVTGVGGVVGGTLSLAIPSSAEREHEDVLGISDPGQRERASHEALSSLAARGKKRRIISAAAFVAMTVAIIVIEKEAFPGALYYAGIFVAPILLIKTRAERTYQNYLKEKEYRKELALRVGIMPYGGVKISLALSF